MDKIKERTKDWKNGFSKTITLIVTKDCQLACKYCYLVGKNNKERMTFDIAKKAIDYIIAHEEDMDEESVVFDFIGGEPFLEIALIDKVCDYIKVELFRKSHHWFNSYRFSFSTNGINYDSEAVQRFIKKIAIMLVLESLLMVRRESTTSIAYTKVRERKEGHTRMLLRTFRYGLSSFLMVLPR